MSQSTPSSSAVVASTKEEGSGEDERSPGHGETKVEDQAPPAQHQVSPDEDSPSSGTTETADENIAMDPHDLMTSSYTAISFDSDSDLEEGADYFERDKTPVVFSDPESSARAVAGSLSLPQLSSTIVSWSEKAAAELETEYGDCSTRPSTTDLLSGSYVAEEGGMVSFVAADLEEKLKLSSPSSPKSSSIGSEQQTELRSASGASIQLDMKLLKQLEEQAIKLNANVNEMIGHIGKSTHTTSKLTVDCTKSYENCLLRTCDSVDSNIRSMYYLMSKCEELNKAMKPIDQVIEDVNQVKRVLDMFEKVVL